MKDKKANWPGSAGICCQCFEPVNESELYQHRQEGRKFHRRCFDAGGYYVQVEKQEKQKSSISKNIKQ